MRIELTNARLESHTQPVWKDLYNRGTWYSRVLTTDGIAMFSADQIPDVDRSTRHPTLVVVVDGEAIEFPDAIAFRNADPVLLVVSYRPAE